MRKRIAEFVVFFLISWVCSRSLSLPPLSLPFSLWSSYSRLSRLSVSLEKHPIFKLRLFFFYSQNQNHPSPIRRPAGSFTSSKARVKQPGFEDRDENLLEDHNRLQFLGIHTAVRNRSLNSAACVLKMDSAKHSAVTPRKSRLARTFAKVLHIRAVTGISPDDDVQKTKSHEKMKKDRSKVTKIPSYSGGDEGLRAKAAKEAFLAKLFASISSVKAAYAQLQYAQSPYDADGIRLADGVVVSELKNLSELKQCYLKKELNETSPETTLVLCEIKEQNSLLRTYEITMKKLDSQLKLKDSEITFLKEKLAEANSDNKLLEKRLNSSGQISIPNNTQLSSLRPSHFIAFLRQSIKSIRSFVRLLINEMESADWDLDAAASSIQPGVSFWKPNHICLAYESFVCREMFDGFNHPNFSTQSESLPEKEKRRRLFFGRFMELKSARPADYLAWKPKSTFSAFCRAKYLRLIHPKMEASLFGNLSQRNLVSSGELPESPFFVAFVEMAKRIWLLHCLALSFDPEVSIFQVSKGSRFSEVYMDSLSDEAFDANPGTDPRVAFMVVPGFRIGEIIVQAQVYLC